MEEKETCFKEWINWRYFFSRILPKLNSFKKFYSHFVEYCNIAAGWSLPIFQSFNFYRAVNFSKSTLLKKAAMKYICKFYFYIRSPKRILVIIVRNQVTVSPFLLLISNFLHCKLIYFYFLENMPSSYRKWVIMTLHFFFMCCVHPGHRRLWITTISGHL